MVSPMLPTAERVATAAVQAGARKMANSGLLGGGAAVLSSAVNKSAGVLNRIHDVDGERPEVQSYVRRRELLNVSYSIAANIGVQALLHKPVTKLLGNKIQPGYVRMMLTAPGLYLSEYFSRLSAGKNKIDAMTARDKALAQSAIKRANVSFASFTPSASQTGFNALV
jgi:hypothetical protein